MPSHLATSPFLVAEEGLEPYENSFMRAICFACAPCENLVGEAGFEPATVGVKVRRAAVAPLPSLCLWVYLTMNHLPVPNWIKALLRSAESRARTKGIFFNLHPQDIQDLWKEQDGRCYWFKVPLLPIQERRHPLLPSLDRVNSNKGYTLGNVVLTCWAANAAKGDADFDTWDLFLTHMRDASILRINGDGSGS